MNIYDIQSLVEEDGIIFLSYGGFLSQTLISGMTEALEAESINNNISLGISNNIFTVFIEISQNMMNYSKDINPDDLNTKSHGLMMVTKDAEKNYYIHSQNVISLDDKLKVEEKIADIKSLDKEGIKKKYRELRRNGRELHDKGAGIGFYEIAKRSDEIDCIFKKINEDRFYLHLKIKIVTQK